MSDYKLIPLTRGQFAKVDVANYEWLNQWKWHAVTPNKGRTFYAVRADGMKMHRLIMGATPNVLVDHKNWKPLDNQRHNLRVCTAPQNRANVKYQGGTSQYTGVHLHPVNKNWVARILNAHLGSFTEEKEAALQYDRAAFEFYGEFAALNFPGEIEMTMLRPFKIPAKTTSPYRGVHFSRTTKKWVAMIAVTRAGKQTRKNLGYFATDADAARAYDLAAPYWHGERAKLNFPAIDSCTISRRAWPGLP